MPRSGGQSFLVIRSGGLTHETTDHLRRGYDFHGIFHRRYLEVAGTRRKLEG
jgi:hypothetical protein